MRETACSDLENPKLSERVAGFEPMMCSANRRRKQAAFHWNGATEISDAIAASLGRNLPVGFRASAYMGDRTGLIGAS
jgi:hypothetical protein